MVRAGAELVITDNEITLIKAMIARGMKIALRLSGYGL